MTVRNKWNKKTYKVIKDEGAMITLERADGSKFTIQKKEFNCAYITENIEKSC